MLPLLSPAKLPTPPEVWKDYDPAAGDFKEEIKLDADGVPTLRVTPAAPDEITGFNACYVLKEPVSFSREWRDAEAAREGVGGVQGFRSLNNQQGATTEQFADPKWKTPEKAQLSFQFYCTQPQKLVMVVNDRYETELAITASDGWQTRVLPADAFICPGNKTLLRDWSTAAKVQIKPKQGADITKVIFAQFKWTPACPTSLENSFADQREEVMALSRLAGAPVMTGVPGQAAQGDLKQVYFDALPWKGRPTKVFAWMGMPAKRIGKVPGVVLVHGGGGTAFKEWVQKWNDHGFAAISIAVEGQTDERAPKGAGTTETGWKLHPWAGPQRSGIYGDSSSPLKDQWMYHAVADAILANSLLRSLPDVDPEKVGLMGVSWGGVIASTVIGIDRRFAFAVPVYGCGHLADAGNQYGRALGGNPLYRQVWDPVLRLGNAMMPVLWFSWPQDEHFPLDCQAANYQTTAGPRMVTLVPGMGHGHQAAWNRPEGYAFAQAVIQTGKPWCRQIESVVRDGNVSVTFASAKPFDDAVLVTTTDTGFTGKRNWVESSAALTRQTDHWKAEAKLPANVTAWFVNFKAGGLVVSSEFHESDQSSATKATDKITSQNQQGTDEPRRK